MKIILFNKPFRVLSQFSPEGDKATLKDYIDIKDVYPAGRLDYDSEGLMILTDDGQTQHQITDPKHKLPKTYWVQVDGEISDTAVQQLRMGVNLKDGMTLPAKVSKMDTPDLWPRTPPVRFRKEIPTSWVSITIKEGRNRQVRRMTAAVGFPTLRLVRYSIGEWTIEGLESGEFSNI